MLTYWIPTQSAGLRRELQNAFRQFDSQTQSRSAQPPLTVWEDDRGVYLEADVPGLSQESLDVRIQDGQLWITGERPLSVDPRQCRHNERMFGPFNRHVPLPDMIDPSTIQAELKDGVLSITMTKKAEAQPHRISIKSGSSNGTAPRLTEDG